MILEKLKEIRKHKTYARIIDFFIEHANKSNNTRSGYIIGSRAQNTPYQNKFSDLDIEIIVKDRDKWAENLEWLNAIGPKKFAYLQKPSDGNGIQIRALFNDMSMVDFVFLNEEEFNKAYSDKQFINGVFGRGVITLFDKDNLLDKFTDTQKSNLISKLTPEKLNTEYKDLLFHLIYAKNKVSQGELLVAKDTIDTSVRKSLIKIIRWQEHLSHPEKDLWHRSRHFEKWASPHNQSLIQHASPRYNKNEIKEVISTIFFSAVELVKDIADHSGIQLDYQADIEDYLAHKNSDTKHNFNRGINP